MNPGKKNQKRGTVTLFPEIALGDVPKNSRIRVNIYQQILQKSNSKSNTIEQCYVRKLHGFPITNDNSWRFSDLDDLFFESQQAVTGFIVDHYEINYEDYDGDFISNDKLKIYACDEEPVKDDNSFWHSDWRLV